jgi:O-antigen/teichoic acid export membrane protein
MDSHAVGVYSALSALIAGVMSLSFTLIALPLYPEVIKFASNPIKLRSAHAQYLAILITLTLPILLGICIVSTAATQLLLGEKYTSENELPFYFIALATYLINLKGHYFDHGLQFTLKTHLTPYIAAFGLLINIPTSYLLIRFLDLLGASIAAAITSLAILLLTWYLAKINNYKFEIPPGTKLVILCNIVIVAFATLTKTLINFNSYYLELIFITSTCTIIYTILLLVTNPFKLREVILNFIQTQRPTTKG